MVWLDFYCGFVELHPCEESAMTSSFTVSFLSCPSHDDEFVPCKLGEANVFISFSLA